MNADQAKTIIALGGKVRRPHWPPGQTLSNADAIIGADALALDWLETEDSNFTETVLAQPLAAPTPQTPPPTLTGKTMPEINVKSEKELTLSATYADAPVDVVSVLSIISSNPDVAAPLKSDKPEIFGIAPGAASFEVSAVVKNAAGELIKVTGTSDPITVIQADGDMVQSKDENGNPVFTTDPTTGAQIPVLEPAKAELTVAVA